MVVQSSTVQNLQTLIKIQSPHGQSTVQIVELTQYSIVNVNPPTASDIHANSGHNSNCLCDRSTSRYHSKCSRSKDKSHCTDLGIHRDLTSELVSKLPDGALPVQLNSSITTSGFDSSDCFTADWTFQSRFIVQHSVPCAQ